MTCPTMVYLLNALGSAFSGAPVSSSPRKSQLRLQLVHAACIQVKSDVTRWPHCDVFVAQQAIFFNGVLGLQDCQYWRPSFAWENLTVQIVLMGLVASCYGSVHTCLQNEIGEKVKQVLGGVANPSPRRRWRAHEKFSTESNGTKTRNCEVWVSKWLHWQYSTSSNSLFHICVSWKWAPRVTRAGW